MSWWDQLNDTLAVANDKLAETKKQIAQLKAGVKANKATKVKPAKPTVTAPVAASTNYTPILLIGGGAIILLALITRRGKGK